MLYVWRDNDVAFVVVSQHVSLQAAVVDVVLDVVENNFHSVYLFKNYIHVDTDFILKDNFRQFRHQLLSIQGKFCFCSNEMQLCRIWRAKQN